MKKLLTTSFIAMAFFFASNSFAQVNFGVKAGLNLATFSGDAVSDAETKSGLVVGGLMQYHFSPMFTLQPEVLYSMKGSEFSGGGVTQTWSVNYLEVPVALRLNIPLQSGSPVSPYIYAGPALGVLLSAEVEQKGQNANNITVDVKDQVTSTDFSLVFGAGIGFNLGGHELGVDFRYGLGLGSIDDSGNNLDVKNNVMSLTASFAF